MAKFQPFRIVQIYLDGVALRKKGKQVKRMAMMCYNYSIQCNVCLKGERLMSHRSRSHDRHLSSLHLRGFFLSYLMVVLPVLLITNLLFYILFVPRYQKEVLQINAETVKGIRLGFERYVTSPIDRI